jgi:hypothetical protein
MKFTKREKKKLVKQLSWNSKKQVE